MAARLMRRPDASLPQQMRSSRALKAAYRLLNEPDVTHAALSSPHWQATRAQAGREDLVLLIQDTTEIDHSQHPKTSGLGPIGNGGGQGYLLQTVLAVVPQPRHVLGIAAQEPFLRKPAPKGQSCVQRRSRERESQVWSRLVQAVGAAPAGSTWVQVGDRYSDIFDFLETCREHGCHFLIRVAQDRRIVNDDGTVESLLAAIRAQAAVDQRELFLPAHEGLAARTAQLSLSLRAAVLRPPADSRKKPALQVWLVRVWEHAPPADVDEPLEWILLLSLPTLSIAEGWQRAEWYSCRWLAEDYHQCLKTGCALEQRHLQSYEALVRLLGFLALIALRLLQLRELARLEPERLASDALPQDLVRVVAALADVAPETLTLGSFWREVARQGGHQGRKGDGPPGWKTLWRGWLDIQLLLEGVHLAARLPP
jgi:hypothetical protein